jgi:predicted ABC-type transport system involved in lysophospholipase L1 biosynthesis ATPase subunit
MANQPAKPARPLLEARGVKRRFKVGERVVEVLHGVDLELHEGELVALMGSSGAGKSTLIQVLGLLDAPDEGEVRYGEVSAWREPPAERARLRNRAVGFVFQFFHLIPELDAVENVLLPAMIGSDPDLKARRRELRERARAMLVEFGLGDRLDHRPAQLSGGEKQRVAIARALLLDPKLVIADEPTGNLDSTTGAKVLDLLLEEQKKRALTLLLVTHDERVAARCSRVVRMKDGRVVDPRG